MMIGEHMRQPTVKFSYAGARLVNAPWMERYAHAMGALVIVLMAVVVLLSGS